MSASQLARVLERIDGRGYKAYRDLEGSYAFQDFTLFVDRVQSDPFASPSKLRVRLPMVESALPAQLFAGRVRNMALSDFLARTFRDEAARAARGGRERRAGSGRSGQIEIDAGGQCVLERSAVALCDDWVEARIEVGLPAAGRRILGREAEALLLDRLPRIVEASLRWERLRQREAEGFVRCIENQECLRARLTELGLVAFVANGSILPRESGASDRPMASGAVPFQSPAAFEVELALENPSPSSAEGRVRGMGVERGVTLIVGGGYHGKSTLLDALESGVYPHVPGDGREGVVASPGLVKVRAEDGRSVAGVDVSPFISGLPGGANSRCFSTADASGSTSQAASIVEALEAGAEGLLLDEDTSATNLMVRDARMQALVAKESEPITPFIDRVREIYDRHGVSSLLVMGGSGDYFDVADRVIFMREFRAHDRSEEARAVATRFPTRRAREVDTVMGARPRRVVRRESLDASRGRRAVKISTRGRDALVFGRNEVDLRALSQLVDESQTRAVGFAIHAAAEGVVRGELEVATLLDALEAWLDEEGLDALDPFGGQGHHPGKFARPRRFEIAAALNRLRGLEVDSR